MFSFKSIVLIAAAFVIGAESSGVAVAAPAVAAAPVAVGYAHAVPQNIPPYAAQVSVFNRAINVAAPLAAAPLAAPLAAAPWATTPYAAAPYYAGVPPVLPAQYAAAYAAPYPYAAAAPLFRAAPFGLPAYVR